MRVNRGALHLMDRVLLGALLLLALLLLGVGVARSAEIVPSVGLARAASGDGAARTFVGVALRGAVLPRIKSEIGVAYRREPYFDQDLHVKMWPVTASLWVSPLPTVYVGVGAGWYHTTYDYRDGLGVQDRTSQEFGTHAGGGLTVPILPAVASLELSGRYVRMRDQQSPIAPEGIRQSFWSTSLGLAIKF